MSKIHRGSSPAEGAPLSAGRVEYHHVFLPQFFGLRCNACRFVADDQLCIFI